MKVFAVVSACFACAGHSRRMQSAMEPSKNQLADLLLALHPHDAFNPSSAGGMRRRELFTRAAAGLAGFSAAQAANAKAGQFSTLDIFSPGYTKTASMPYLEGGPTAGNEDQGATYGYQTSEGEALGKGFRKDVKDEKTAFGKSEKIFLALEDNLKKANWFIVGDDLREQAQSMRTSMKSITQYGAKEPGAAKKAYDAFWLQIGKLDGAVKKKDQSKATEQFGKAVLLLDAWKKVAIN